MKANGKSAHIGRPPGPAKMVALYWWIDRWRKSTAYTDMTIEEQGAYRNLLDEAWLRGGTLPKDMHILSKACGDPRRWPAVKRAVLRHFRTVKGTLVNDTLVEIHRQSQRRSENQRAYRQRFDARSR